MTDLTFCIRPLCRSHTSRSLLRKARGPPKNLAMEEVMRIEDIAVLELRSMQQAWRAMSRRRGLTEAERRALFPAGGIDEDHPPADTETRKRLQVEIFYRINMPQELLRDWLRSPMVTLHWQTPLDVMSGSLADLRGFRRLVEAGYGA